MEDLPSRVQRNIIERFETIRADEDIEIASGTVAAGTISGMRFEIIGVADGEERIVVEHVTRLRDEDAPEWPQGHGYRIVVSGEPNVELELALTSDRGDHNHAGNAHSQGASAQGASSEGHQAPPVSSTAEARRRDKALMILASLALLSIGVTVAGTVGSLTGH